MRDRKTSNLLKIRLLRVIAIYIIAFLMFIYLSDVKAMEYDVSWIKTDGEYSILAIIINNCETQFKIKTTDVKAMNNDDAVKRLLQKAINNCR